MYPDKTWQGDVPSLSSRVNQSFPSGKAVHWEETGVRGGSKRIEEWCMCGNSVCELMIPDKSLTILFHFMQNE